MNLTEQVEQALETIRPYLIADGGDVAPEHHGGRPQPAPLLHQGHEPAHAHREHAPGQCGLHPGGQGP